MRIRTSFSPAYAVADVSSLARLGVAADELARQGLVELHAPPPLDPALLRGLHDETYLHAFLHGREPLASSQGIRWSPALRDATLAMLSGQLDAARHALAHGVAMNLARGFHHAVYERGAGFCPLNGLALVAHALPGKRIFVVDCDEHGGNGTEEYAARLPNLFNASVFGTRFGCIGHERSWPFEVRVSRDGFAAYARALTEIGALLERHRPDLVLYQAGTDCHVGDPKSRARLSTRRLLDRDLRVFRMLRRLGLPVVVVVAGGYQNADAIAALNVQTVRAAIHVFGPSSIDARNSGALAGSSPPLHDTAGHTAYCPR